MTTHTPASASGHDQSSLPNQPFFSWLRTQTTLFISQIAAILGLVYFLAAMIYYVTGATEHGEFLFDAANIKVFVDYVHIVIIAVFILVLIRYLDDNEPGSYRVGRVYKRVFNDDLNKHQADDGLQENLRKANAQSTAKNLPEGPLEKSTKQLKKFKRRFLWFWCAMLVLYVVFGWDHTYEWVTSHKWVTTQPPADDNETTPNLRLAFSILEFVFNNLSLLFVYLCFLSMYLTPDRLDADKTRQRWHLGLSIALIVVFTGLFPLFVFIKGPLLVKDFRAFNAVFDALSGTINAVVLALLISRLDSKLIGLSSRLICVLYSYAAVQPLFVAFAQGPESVLEGITASVLIFVLVSKIYFFLIIMYALQTGRMLNYLACFPELRRRGQETLSIVNHPRQCKDESANGIGTTFILLCLDIFDGPKATLSRIMRSDVVLTVSKWLGIASVAVFLIFLIVHVANYESTPNPNSGEISLLSVGIHIAQLTVLLAMIVMLLLVRKDNGCHVDSVSEAAKDIFKEKLDLTIYMPTKAETHVQKFKKYFCWFWIATLVLYGVLLLEELQVEEIVITVIGTPAIAVLFYPFLKFSVGTLNLLFVFWCFVVLQSPAYDDLSERRQKVLINYSSFVISLLVAAFLLLASFAVGNGAGEAKLIGYATVFDGLTGMLSGVALALLIARLDSKLFNLKSSLIYILFAYAAIQPLFVVFELEKDVFKTIEAAVLIAAFGLKICFFLIIANTLQSGKMLNYLVCFPFLRDRVDSIFENQFEIRTSRSGEKHTPFTFAIWRKNALIYTSGRYFKTRKKCDMAIEELRDLAEKIDPGNQPQEVAGTYWVEIRKGRQLICESVPLRSKKEREELIKESRGMIPHCKYNRG